MSQFALPDVPGDGIAYFTEMLRQLCDPHAHWIELQWARALDGELEAAEC